MFPVSGNCFVPRIGFSTGILKLGIPYTFCYFGIQRATILHELICLAELSLRQGNGEMSGSTNDATASGEANRSLE